MVSTLHNLTLLHDDDFISILDCAQSVGHNHNGLLATIDQFVKRLLHLELTLSVQSRSRFVE